MKIKAWFSGLKQWAARLLKRIVTDGANNSDDWWRHSGGFPGDW